MLGRAVDDWGKIPPSPEAAALLSVYTETPKLSLSPGRFILQIRNKFQPSKDPIPGQHTTGNLEHQGSLWQGDQN